MPVSRVRTGSVHKKSNALNGINRANIIPEARANSGVTNGCFTWVKREGRWGSALKMENSPRNT
jgi:hypothetical protein